MLLLQERIRAAGSAAEVLSLAEGAGVPLAHAIADAARVTAHEVVRGAAEIEVVIVDRSGGITARVGK